MKNVGKDDQWIIDRASNSIHMSHVYRLFTSGTLYVSHYSDGDQLRFSRKYQYGLIYDSRI